MGHDCKWASISSANIFTKNLSNKQKQKLKQQAKHKKQKEPKNTGTKSKAAIDDRELEMDYQSIDDSEST